MEIKHNKAEQILELTLHGKLGTFFGVKELEDLLTEYNKEEIKFMLMDMSDISYISSAAIRVLLQTQKKLAFNDGDLLLIGLQPACKEVLEITGIIDIIPSYENKSAALQHINEQA